MADFLQNGVVTTLHNLTRRPVEEMESELIDFARRMPMALILPSLYSELNTPALPAIAEKLSLIPYIHDVTIGLDRANETEFKEFKAFMGKLPQHTKVLWHDGPRMSALDQELTELGLAPPQPGKGRNVWYCFGYTLAVGRARAIALHDCDILTYERDLVARLFYPVANPNWDFQFVKGYYARINENNRLSGRVTRLYVAPLLRAMKKVVGPLDYLEFLDSFRYPLSGEFAMRTDVLRSVRIPSDWGLEVGTLSEVYRNLHPRQIAQVDIADRYDHKHQDVAAGNPSAGLSRMSIEIAKSIYRKLATEGITLNAELFRTIKATYLRTALDMLSQYQYDAEINGLSIDCHAEEETVEVFTQSIITAGEQFLANPTEVPFIPNWNRVFSAVPDFGVRLIEAVDADNEEH
ncbi:MAG: glycosyl transferase [Gammaproteobacteria bacterium]